MINTLMKRMEENLRFKFAVIDSKTFKRIKLFQTMEAATKYIQDNNLNARVAGIN